ncbi:serine hydrolase [Streptomyces sp. NPDC096198]|uniref:serine hydrolase n=1 Tax=Streptomyces sp. NPDC096198 TaxID=3366080 RepID=UPI00382CF3E5
MPVPAATPPAVMPTSTLRCKSTKADLADNLRKDITATLEKRHGTVAIGLYDRTTGTTCTLRGAMSYDAASTVKVTVLATLLWDAKKNNRYLTRREASLARNMITRSDNNATTELWEQLGLTRLKGFLVAARMTNTFLGKGGCWGLTQENVNDEQKLLKLVTTKNNVLSDPSRAYILKLMGQVIATQRWDRQIRTLPTVSVHVKNGWLQRATHGWRVHSLSIFNGSGYDYMVSVLSQDNSTMSYGVSTIQGIAEVIHKDLAPPESGRK